ncbi:DUF3574 domain-containing protein [Streptomyces bambusae]|uniref:DUF3574 domain-containing protein n=1 Tax=Streptomyces bambusae TaxID=1550616 RepID=A0ABS6Z6T4_9ACTN|nr:DUF3574 domain-containing protein [Streptomyces bambusae]MBW5483447.1 DUF3574 domain-containing protein [Streptomyces bambusae]
MKWTTEARGKVGGGVLLMLLGAGIPALVGALQGDVGQPYHETRLYFGTQRAHGGEIGEKEFTEFLDRAVTPAFPEGLTLQEGRGQWREADGDIVREHSYELVLLYPEKEAENRSVHIERIRRAYQTDYDQDSVGRSDDQVKVDF